MNSNRPKGMVMAILGMSSAGRVPGDNLSLSRFLKNSTSGEIARKVVYVRDGVGVSNGAFIEAPIVFAWVGRSILLGDHVEARAPRGIRVVTDARGAHQVKVLLRDPEFLRGQSPW